MCPYFYDITFIKNDYLIGFFYSCESMGNDDGRTVFRYFIGSILNHLFRM